MGGNEALVIFPQKTNPSKSTLGLNPLLRLTPKTNNCPLATHCSQRLYECSR